MICTFTLQKYKKSPKYAKKMYKITQKFAQIKKKQYICKLFHVRVHGNE